MSNLEGKVRHTMKERLGLAKDILKLSPGLIIESGLGLSLAGGLYTTIGAGLSSWGFFLADKPEYTKIAAITQACGLGVGVAGTIGWVFYTLLLRAFMGENDKDIPIVLSTDCLKSHIRGYRNRWYS